MYFPNLHALFVHYCSHATVRLITGFSVMFSATLNSSCIL